MGGGVRRAGTHSSVYEEVIEIGVNRLHHPRLNRSHQRLNPRKRLQKPKSWTQLIREVKEIPREILRIQQIIAIIKRIISDNIHSHRSIPMMEIDGLALTQPEFDAIY
jgi:hypothetical protein